ncbi:MAG: hypothetical protein ACR2LH_07815, partial [Thermoleophilaceae bacterium]
VRGSVRLRATSPTAPGRVRGIGVRGFWEALEHELRCDPGEWWPVGGESWPAAEGESWAPAAAPPGAGAGSTRALRDRRGEGFSGVAGELLTSGEPTLVVVADLERRRATLEERVAGMAAGALLPAICWADLGADPAAAAGYTHLLVLDPPPVPEGLELLASGEGGAHLAWGEAERAFALACWRASSTCARRWPSCGGRCALRRARWAAKRSSGHCAEAAAIPAGVRAPGACCACSANSASRAGTPTRGPSRQCPARTGRSSSLPPAAPTPPA